MSEKIIIEVEYEGSRLIGANISCTAPSQLEVNTYGGQPVHELKDWGACEERLRIESYCAFPYSGVEVKGGNKWSEPRLAILLTEVSNATEVPLKQKCTLRGRGNTSKMSPGGAFQNSLAEWIK